MFSDSHRRHIPRPILAGVVAALAALAAGTGAAADAIPPRPQPQLEKVTKGKVSFGIPKGWKDVTLPNQTSLIGMWSPDGRGLLDPELTAMIFVGWADAADLKLKFDPNSTVIISDKEVVVGGQPARRVEVQEKGSGPDASAVGRAVGVVFKKPGPDGKYLAFFLGGRPDQWNTLGPLYDTVIASITLEGVEPAGTGPFVTAVYLDMGVEKPLEGATVLVGRRLDLFPLSSVPAGEFWEDALGRLPFGSRGGPIDLLTGEALFLTGTTGGDGKFAPNLPPGKYDVVVWKAGHIPQTRATVTLPGGGFKAYVSPDNQVGATDRHRTLDTSRVFKMDPPNPAKPVLWGRVTLGERTSPTSIGPSPARGEDVTIVVGENLSFVSKQDPRSPGAFTDVVQGDQIFAEVKANKDGTYAIPVPTGPYSLIIWKKGYIPEERVAINVWPGDYFCKLIKDDQPGGTGRHQALDTTSLNIPRKALDSRPGIRGVVRVSDRGLRKPGEAVTVLVGQGLRLKHPVIPNPTDEVMGTMLLARVETNKDGDFFVPVPAGAYHLIVWKAGHIPQEFDTVTVPPGVHNVTLILDNQPGGSGRHQQLDTRGVPVPPPPAAPSPLVTLLPFVLGSAPPQLAPRTAGDVSLGVPADWRKDPDAPADEGAWLVGKADNPDAFFGVLRDVSFDGLVEALTDAKRAEVKVGGRAAIRHTGVLRDDPATRLWLAVLTAPEKDGRRIAFLARAPSAAWLKHTDTFDAILASVKLPTVTPPPPAEQLKQLARFDRIPDLKADFSLTVYEDRVVIADAAGKSLALGVAGRGKAIGANFRPFLDKEKAVAGVLGEAVSLQLNALGGAVKVQLFEGGELVQEVASGAVWWNTHAKRSRDLRPADEITRYPYVVLGGVQYAVATYPDRVHVWDVAAKKETAVKVGPAGQAVPEAFRKIIDKDKVEPALGRAVSAEVALFDTPFRLQVYEGGALFVRPDTGGYWWCSHPKRGATGGGTVTPPAALALPKDPDAVVVRVDYVGGYTPPRKTNDPYLVIRADGRVTLTDPFGKLPTVQAKITPDNVLDFVKFAVAEHDFLALDSAAIERAVKEGSKNKKLPTITDLPTTVVTIRTADRVHEVKCYAPEFYAEQLPDLKSVAQFHAVHARLARYMDALRVDKP